MKRQLFLHLTGWLFAATLLSSCLSEETEEAGTPGSANRQPLTVSVTEGGLLPAAGTPTRATEMDFQTAFTAGDSIGLYVVQDGAIKEGGNNLLLILDANGQWNFAAGQALYYHGQNAPIQYYAYYPYQQDMEGRIAETATGDESFFALLIRDWTPVEDQSDYARYTASDLMTGTGSVRPVAPGDPHILTIALMHRMALAIIKTPTFHYTTTHERDVWYHGDALSSLPVIWSHRLKGYQSEAGVYRYIGNPTTNPILGVGLSSNLTFTVNFSVIRRGSYSSDNLIDPTVPLPTTRALAVGDFYMDDATIVPKDIFTLPPGCIGVVLKVGRDTSGEWMDDATYTYRNSQTVLATPHAYVLAVHNQSRTIYFWTLLEPGVEIGVGQMVHEGFHGYKNTQKIAQYIADNQISPSQYSALFEVTSNMENRSPTPSLSSGWFMPSSGQLQYLITNKEQILPSLRVAKENKAYEWEDYPYWSNSEDSNLPLENMWSANIKQGKMEAKHKQTAGLPLSFLVF